MSERALALITANKSSRAISLDLGRCVLTALPEELGELVWLESLSLADNWFEWDGTRWQYRQSQNTGDNNSQLTDIAVLAKLPRLRYLYIALTHIADMSPLAGLSNLQVLGASNTKLNTLAPLAGLSNLQALDVSYTEIADLGPLAGLHALRALAAASTHITDLAPIAGLSNLQELDVSRTAVADITVLEKLTALQTLKIAATAVKSLAPLVGLAALSSVDIAQTPVTDLLPLENMLKRAIPVVWQDANRQSAEIYIEDCNISNPPAEIIALGNAAIIEYFREQRAGPTDYLYEAKLLILGEGGSGKTSLLRRLYFPDQALPEEQETTKGIAIYRHDFPLGNGRKFRLNVWDFGGQEIYHATHQFFLTGRSIYVLVDDTRKDHKTASDPGFKDWLDLIETFGGDSPVLLFQNEKGGRRKTIDLAGIRGRYPNVKELYEGNLEHGAAANALRAGINFFASQLPHIGEKLPPSWIKIRAELEQTANQVPYISQQAYFDIYSHFLPFERLKALHLSRYLHDLGIFLHYQDDPLLARTVILRNTWATEAVYKMLDDATVKSTQGRFTLGDCARLWQGDEYADMHLELLALMQRFELCYALPDQQPPVWLAPQLLPATLPNTLQNWEKPGDLMLRYRYQFMPKGIVSRLLVRLHRFLHGPERACLTAVLFERDETALLAQLSPDGVEIELRARGPERKALLNVVVDELDAINNGFAGLRDKVSKWIPCVCNVCSATLHPHLYAEQELRRRVEAQRFSIECPSSFTEVDALVLLEGIHLRQLPAWSAQQPPPAKRAVNPFSGLAQYTFSSEPIAPGDEAQFDNAHRFRLKQLHIGNFRCFESLRLDLDRKLTVFVAKNGGGKSTVLDAIAIALGGFVEGFYIGASQMIEDKDVRLLKTDQSQALNQMERQYPAGIRTLAEIDAKPVDWANALNSIDADKNWVESRKFTEMGAAMQNAVSNNTPVVLPLVAYYGTSRLHVAAKNGEAVAQETFDDEFFSRTAGYQDCLDPATHYKDFEKWFIYASKADASTRLRQQEKMGAQYVDADTVFTPLLQAVRQAVNTCLAVSGWANLHFSFTHTKLMMEHSDHGVFEVNSLSDGVRNMIALVADIAHRAVRLNPHLRSDAARRTPGIVLIDEVDLHLHPAWQREVLQNLCAAFPSLQFIVTTHSPHIVQAAEPDQIIGLSSDKNIGHQQDLPEGRYGFQGWEVDEVLLDVMNLADTRTNKYNEALASFERAIDEEDYDAGLRAFELVSALLHPANYLRKLLKFQLADIKGTNDD
jgi:internalin A